MDGGPSRTALAAAMYRAAHQVMDEGAVFRDPFAVKILPAEARRRLDGWMVAQQRQMMRGFIAYRSHVAETKLADAIGRGVRQIVIVGAGLDTLCLRNPWPEAALYEVDHPATQQWKRARLAEIGAELAPNVRFAPIDFEREDLGDALAAAGLDVAAPAFFSWLGVVPYLTDDAIFETLELIASVPGGEVVFDYSNPIEQLEPSLRRRAQVRADRAASIGEPFLSAFDTAALGERLEEMGAVEIDDIGPQRLRGGAGSDAGGHIVHVRFGADA